MFRHRLAPEAEYYRLPASPAPQFRPASFALCPVAILPGCHYVDWTRAIYSLALEQAIEVARPALPNRGLLAFWN
jgi:hypothetical protein